jgi:hypothetical protein
MSRRAAGLHRTASASEDADGGWRRGKDRRHGGECHTVHCVPVARRMPRERTMPWTPAPDGGRGWSSRPPTPIFSYFSVKCASERNETLRRMLLMLEYGFCNKLLLTESIFSTLPLQLNLNKMTENLWNYLKMSFCIFLRTSYLFQWAYQLLYCIRSKKPSESSLKSILFQKTLIRIHEKKHSSDLKSFSRSLKVR